MAGAPFPIIPARDCERSVTTALLGLHRSCPARMKPAGKVVPAGSHALRERSGGIRNLSVPTKLAHMLLKGRSEFFQHGTLARVSCTHVNARLVASHPRALIVSGNEQVGSVVDRTGR